MIEDQYPGRHHPNERDLKLDEHGIARAVEIQAAHVDEPRAVRTTRGTRVGRIGARRHSDQVQRARHKRGGAIQCIELIDDLKIDHVDVSNCLDV